MKAVANVLVPDLDDEERQFLHEFAAKIRDRPVRPSVARDALEAVAKQLEAAAQR